MEVALALTVGIIFACSTYLLLRRSLVKVVIGLALLSQAANLLIFTSAGLDRANPPIIPKGATVPLEATTDPLPQALILTAIVIAFGLIAFTLVLFQRAYRAIGTDDLDEMHSTDARVIPLEYRG